jgi:hypothetical protein
VAWHAEVGSRRGEENDLRADEDDGNRARTGRVQVTSVAWKLRPVLYTRADRTTWMRRLAWILDHRRQAGPGAAASA